MYLSGEIVGQAGREQSQDDRLRGAQVTVSM